MKIIVTGHDNIVGPWVCSRAGGSWSEGRGTTIGLLDTASNKLICGVLYEDFNGANLSMHIAAEPGARWAQSEFLRVWFDYPFRQLGCKRITGIIASTNTASRRMAEHLGLVLEATLKDAHPEGDLLIYAMRKQDCRWLNIKEKARHGEELSACRA